MYFYERLPPIPHLLLRTFALVFSCWPNPFSESLAAPLQSTATERSPLLGCLPFLQFRPEFIRVLNGIASQGTSTQVSGNRVYQDLEVAPLQYGLTETTPPAVIPDLVADFQAA